MNTPSTSLLHFLTDITVRATVLLALTAIIAILSRRASASFRHLIWSLGLGCAILLPLAALMLPSWRVAVRTLPPASQPAPQAQIVPSVPNDGVMPPLPSPVPDLHPTPADRVVVPVLPDSAPSIHPLALPARIPWSAVILLLWASGTVLVMVRLAQGLATVRRIERESVPVTDGPAVGALADARALMKVGRLVALRQASAPGLVTVPLTYGALRPVIVLPAEITQWPQERLRAALLHEMAHVRRGDWPLCMLAHVTRALYWFHPLVWLSTQRARAESETAADDLVLAAGTPAQDYARHLLDVALCARRQDRLGSGAVAMAQTPKIEGRLRLILSRGRRRGEIGGRDRAAILAVAVSLLALGSVVHVASRAAGTADGGQSPSSHVRVADASNPRVILSNGVTVRLVGVTDTQALGLSQWWAADGLPVAESLPKNTLRFPALPTGVRGRAFAVETIYAPHTQPSLVWTTPPPSDWAFAHDDGDNRVYSVKPNQTLEFVPDEHINFLNHDQMQERTQGPQATRLTVDSLSARASQRIVTLMYAVAAGPWTESVTCKKTSGKVYLKTPSGDVIFTLIPNPHHLPAPKAARGNAMFMVSDHFRAPSPEPTANALQVALRAGENLDRKVLALDRSGRIVTELSGGVLTWPDSPSPTDYRHIKTMQNSSIPNFLLKRIASFHLLARPYQWAEFRGVQLQPQTSAASTPPPATSQVPSDTAAAHIARGKELQQKGQPRDGIPEFRKAVQINPNDAEAQYQLAQALYQINWKRTGNSTESLDTPPAILDEAILHLRKAVLLRPDDPHWLSTLGTYLENRGKDAESATFFRRALHLLGPARYMSVLHRIAADGSGKAGEVYDNQWSLGDALLKTGQYGEAAIHYQEALRYSPQADWVWLGYGDALKGSGRRAEARAAWHKCLSVQPPNPYYQRQAEERLARQ